MTPIRPIQYIETKIRYEDGAIAYFTNGIRHRDNGPAFIYPDGTEEFWHFGEKCVMPEDVESGRFITKPYYQNRGV